MNTPPTNSFPAVAIAKALGITKRAVLQTLGSTPAAALPVQGGEAKAWPLSALPAPWRAELEAKAIRLGCRNAEHFLQDGGKPWTPPAPVNQVSRSFLNKAGQLREALALPLRRQHEIQGAALDQLGLTEYSRVFGIVITARHWRRLFDRTVQRDNGREDWQRLDIYIDDAAFARRPAPAPRTKPAFDHADLKPSLDEIKDRANPTVEDRAWLFHNAFRHLEQVSALLDCSRTKKAFKASLIDYLAAATVPAFSKSSPALRRLFDRTLIRWNAGGQSIAAIIDKRPTKSGQKPYSCPTCEQKVNHQARNYRGQGGKMGNVSLAWRQLWTKGEICPQCQERYSLDMRTNKSYVPANFRRRATPTALELAKDRGPKHLRDAGPYFPRDYSDLEPGQLFVIDDETPNQITCDLVEGQWITGACQNIEGIDARCFYPLDFIMYIGAPTANMIKRLLWQLFFGSKIGKPDFGLLLEGGVFASRLIVGEFNPGEERSWQDIAGELQRALGVHFGHLGLKRTEGDESDCEMGIRDAGIDIRRAYIHRAKVIEGYFNHTQRLSSHLPGYGGNCQRFEIKQSLADFLLRVKAGKEDPRNELLTIDELRANYRAIREEYMHTPQNGKMLRGSTPFEMWQERINRKPLREVDPTLEYTVSTHRKPVKLTEHGVKIRLSKHEDALYYSPELGQWYNRRIKDVLAYFDIFDRSHITISDMKRENRLRVPRALLKSCTATREELSEANRLRRGFIAEATAGFGNLSHPLRATIIRRNEHTEAERELGQFHNEAKEREKATETEAQKIRRRINTLCDELGQPRPDMNTTRVPARQLLESLEWEMERRQKTTSTSLIQ